MPTADDTPGDTASGGTAGSAPHGPAGGTADCGAGGLAEGIAPELLRRPFTTADGLGHVTRHRLEAGGSFARVARGAWTVADEAPSYGRRIQGVLARSGHRSVLLGPSAAWAHGCRHGVAGVVVHLAGPGRSGPDVVRHKGRLQPGDVVVTAMGPATSLTRTAVDLARGVGSRELGHVDRVAWVDAFLRATGLPVSQARTGLVAAVGLHGLATARHVLRDARDGVDSPKETELRLLVTGAGLPEPVTQCPVVLGGRVVARLDLGWPEARAGAEYDGAVHLDRHQHSRDLDRHNAVRVAGWAVLQVDHRLLRRPRDLVSRLSALLSRPCHPHDRH